MERATLALVSFGGIRAIVVGLPFTRAPAGCLAALAAACTQADVPCWLPSPRYWYRHAISGHVCRAPVFVCVCWLKSRDVKLSVMYEFQPNNAYALNSRRMRLIAKVPWLLAQNLAQLSGPRFDGLVLPAPTESSVDGRSTTANRRRPTPRCDFSAAHGRRAERA